MKKMINIRNSVIIVLCFTVVFMAFGFILVSAELKHEKDAISSFHVDFTKSIKISSAKGSTIEPIGESNIDENGKVVHFHFTLNHVHDEIIYVTSIKNSGTLPAKVVDIVETPNYQDEVIGKNISPVVIRLSDVKGKTLMPNEEIEVKLVVYYNASLKESGKKDFDYDLTLITESIP